MTIQQGHQQLLQQLYPLYDNREAAQISELVMEHITGQRRIDRILHKDLLLNPAQLEQLHQYGHALQQYRPLQYVLQEAWFAGMSLYVDEQVLIPRPETEELAEWIITSAKEQATLHTLLDIGTGSGCIALAVKKKLPRLQVQGLDVSEGALQVARRNAATQGLDVSFYQANILDETSWQALPPADIFVSNPPYIRSSEKASMHRNVLDFEPHEALFVEEEDPLLFYRKITALGQQQLHSGGWLFFEINEALGRETAQLLETAGYKHIELRKDLQGKERMLKAAKR